MTVELPYRYHELQRMTHAMMAAGGAFDRYSKAQARLCDLVMRNMLTPEAYAVRRASMKGYVPNRFTPPAPEAIYSTRSFHKRLSLRDAEAVMIGHDGLMGEWGNGPGQVLLYTFGKSMPEGSFIPGHLIADAASSFFNRSQLTGGSAGRVNPLAVRLRLKRETSQEAFGRSTKFIQQWMDANQDILPQEEQRAITDALAEQQATLAPILAWANYAAKWQAQMGQPLKPDSRAIGK